MSSDNKGFWQKLKSKTSNGWNKIKSSSTYQNAKEALKNNVGNIAGSVYNKASPIIDAALLATAPELLPVKKTVDLGIKYAPAAADMLLGTKSKVSKQIKDFQHTSSGNAPKWNLLETENAVVNPTASIINTTVPYIPGLFGSAWRGIKRINVIKHRNDHNIKKGKKFKFKIKQK